MNVIYSALSRGAYPFESLADRVATANYPDDLKDTNSALVVWGGADIHPDLYGHPQDRTTYPGGARDWHESALMDKAIASGIPIIGVCRGAQMLCAKAGGFLIQDVDNHVGGHSVITKEGTSFRVNSLHHQMMAGFENLPHELFAVSEKNLGSYYTYKNGEKFPPPENWKEPEAIYFTEIKGMAIQWHPEMMGEDTEANQWLLTHLKNIFNT